jgi:cell division protein FtsW
MEELVIEKTIRHFKLNIVLLVSFGILMVYSSSYIYAKEIYGNSAYYLIRQLTFVVFGAVAAMLFAKTKFDFWYKHAYVIHAVITALCFLALVKFIGVNVKGSYRWINFGLFRIQPGEFVKYSTLLASIRYFDEFQSYLKDDRFKKGLLLLSPLLALILQPDFGTFLICSLIMVFVCFLSSFPRKYFYSSVVTGFIFSSIILISAPYRVKRLMSFLDPWADPKDTGFQIIQSFLAFAHGSIFGQGLGNSNEKLFYLPEAHNDLIFSVVGEELGFVGVVTTIILYLGIIYFGFKLAVRAEKRRVKIFVSSIVFLVGLQAFLNMGVVLGLLPTKGLNLPFISYGGSSLVANLCAMGMVFCALKLENSSDTQQSSNFQSSFNFRK